MKLSCNAWCAVKRIKLVDRCLILFMFIFMAQSIFNLFFSENISYESSVIDTMIRTTSAAIFGYFLSINFIKKSTPKRGLRPPFIAPPSRATADADYATATTNRIGFSVDQTRSPSLTEGGASVEAPPLVADEDLPESDTSHQQVIIATCIGVFALVTLIVARNFLTLTPATVGTISQMRDFVSGCVGFLLGSPGSERR